jgi:hypothetical protein
MADGSSAQPDTHEVTLPENVTMPRFGINREQLPSQRMTLGENRAYQRGRALSAFSTNDPDVAYFKGMERQDILQSLQENRIAIAEIFAGNRSHPGLVTSTEAAGQSVFQRTQEAVQNKIITPEEQIRILEPISDIVDRVYTETSAGYIYTIPAPNEKSPTTQLSVLNIGTEHDGKFDTTSVSVQYIETAPEGAQHSFTASIPVKDISGLATLSLNELKTSGVSGKFENAAPNTQTAAEILTKTATEASTLVEKTVNAAHAKITH